LLFGPESSGLDNEAVERCQRTARIPADPAFTSLNLASAVTVVLYELRRQASAQRGSSPALAHEPTADEAPGTAREQRHLVEHLRRVLTQTSADPERAASVVKKLTRMLNRAAPEHGELQLLRGLLSAVEAKRDEEGA
jgi:tRNA C32,U32 (ribose-2'-O)-methylase TrmJ